MKSLDRLWDSILKLVSLLFEPVVFIPLMVYIIWRIYKKIKKHLKYKKQLKEYENTEYYKSTQKSFDYIKSDKGASGEYLIYDQIKGYEKQGAKFLFNLYIPKDSVKTTEIDVLMIWQKGLVVFESKNLSGYIFGSENQNRWCQSLRAKYGGSEKYYFYNPIMQNDSHINHLKAFLGTSVLMHSFVVFSNTCLLMDIDIKRENAYLIYRDEVGNTLFEIYKNSPDVLSESEIDDIYNKLYPYTQVSDEVVKKHISDIK